MKARTRLMIGSFTLKSQNRIMECFSSSIKFQSSPTSSYLSSFLYHTNCSYYLKDNLKEKSNNSNNNNNRMSYFMAKKKTIVESLADAKNMTEAMKLFYESPKQRDAEYLILCGSLSVEECLAIYNFIKQQQKGGGINEKIIVAMLSVGKDRKLSADDRELLLNDTYNYIMSFIQVGEKNSMNDYKWNIIISQFCCDSTVHNTSRALDLLNKSEEFGAIPSKFVLGSLLSACIKAELYKSAIEVFAKLEKHHIKMDVIHFNFYVKALAKMKYTNAALEAVKKMELLNLKPDSFIYSTLISMCGETRQIDTGRQLHKIVQQKGLSNIYVDTSLIHMYCSCGMLDEASNLFNNMERKDLVAWNAIIHGYGTNNEPKKSLDLFQEMQQYKVAPDNQTFVCLLDACSVGGLLVEGFQIFRSMEREFNIVPDIRHYGCMIKLLLNENEYYMCLQVLKEMNNKNIQTDSTIQKLILKKMQEDPDAEELRELIDMIEHQEHQE